MFDFRQLLEVDINEEIKELNKRRVNAQVSKIIPAARAIQAGSPKSDLAWIDLIEGCEVLETIGIFKLVQGK